MGKMPNILQVGEKLIAIEYFQSKSRNSTAKIHKDKVVIRLSKYANENKYEEIIAHFLKWAEKKMAKMKIGVSLLPKYKDGEVIKTYNKDYLLKIYKSLDGRNKVHLNGGDLEVYLNDVRKLRDLVDKKIMDDQMEELQDILFRYNDAYFRKEIGEIKFKRIKSRFGSCSSRGNINISYRLLFAPREVFEYVCVHELAHLIEFNHSKRFWELVALAMPDYKKHDKWLKDNVFLLD